MRFFLTFLSFLPPLAIGFLIVSVFWHKDRHLLSDLPLKCCLSVGFGFGASSCSVFIWMMVVGQLTRSVFICELMLLVGLCLLLGRQRRASGFAATGQSETSPIPFYSSPYFLRFAICVSSVSAAICFLFLSRQSPHGQFDAYAHWNLWARFIYRGGTNWAHSTYMTWSHPDYPLLIPVSIARSWKFSGLETQLVPGAIGLLFTVATIATVAISISHFRGERQGLLAGLVLLGTPFLIIHGASQYADVPLSFFFVATMVLLFLHAQRPAHTGFLILAGMAAAFSAWTKNEGIFFATMTFLFYWIVSAVTKKRSVWTREMGAFCLGAIPVITVIVVDKVCLTASNDLVAAQGAGATLHDLLDISRYHLIISEFARELFRFGQWSPVFAMPMLLLFYFLLLGASVDKKDIVVVSVAALLPVGMAVGYFFVYVLSPHDLAWHLESSLSRLLLQLWPLAIFAYFAVVRSPEQALIPKSTPGLLPTCSSRGVSSPKQ